MKGAVRLLILFICFITIQSDAQRGWRFLDPMIFPTPRSSQTPYYESRDCHLLDYPYSEKGGGMDGEKVRLATMCAAVTAAN